MALAPLLQVRVIRRTRDAAGTSMCWVLILLVGFVLWLAYGLVHRDLPIIITNLVSVLAATVLVVTVRLYRHRGKYGFSRRTVR
jgi:MtN3 and saliva related transmembrane protein